MTDEPLRALQARYEALEKAYAISEDCVKTLTARVRGSQCGVHRFNNEMAQHCIPCAFSKACDERDEMVDAMRKAPAEFRRFGDRAETAEGLVAAHAATLVEIANALDMRDGDFRSVQYAAKEMTAERDRYRGALGRIAEFRNGGSIAYVRELRCIASDALALAPPTVEGGMEKP